MGQYSNSFPEFKEIELRTWEDFSSLKWVLGKLEMISECEKSDNSSKVTRVLLAFRDSDVSIIFRDSEIIMIRYKYDGRIQKNTYYPDGRCSVGTMQLLKI